MRLLNNKIKKEKLNTLVFVVTFNTVVDTKFEPLTKKWLDKKTPSKNGPYWVLIIKNLE